jgi:thymidylate kinase
VQAPDRGLPAPDLVLYLDIPLEVAEQRGGYGQERYEKREMQQQVRRLLGSCCRMVCCSTLPYSTWSVLRPPL